jgi:hypothetical protein
MNEFDAVGTGQSVPPASLRPMNLGEILDRAVQMLKSHFMLFAGIAVAPALATLVYSLASNSTLHRLSGDSQLWKFAFLGLTIVSWLGIVILTPIAAGVKCWATSRLLLDRPATIRSAYGAFKDRKGGLVGLGFMQGLLSLWPAAIGLFVATLLLMGHPNSEPGFLYFLVIFVALVPCAPLYARYLLAYPATAIAGLTVSESLKRSVELGRGFRWRVFWAYALPVGIGMVIIGGGSGLLEWIGHLMRLQMRHPFLFFAIQGLWTFAGALIYHPLTSIAITLTYYDLCVRKEGFDVVRMMERAGLVPASAETEPA